MPSEAFSDSQSTSFRLGESWAAFPYSAGWVLSCCDVFILATVSALLFLVEPLVTAVNTNSSRITSRDKEEVGGR